MINTVRGVAIDIRAQKPYFANVSAGLSGPAIKPIGLCMVWDCFAKIPECRDRQVPIIGIGGISTWQDAVEYLLAGASAVQVGTAWFVYPDVFLEIKAGLAKYLAGQQHHRRQPDRQGARVSSKQTAALLSNKSRRGGSSRPVVTNTRISRPGFVCQSHEETAPVPMIPTTTARSMMVARLALVLAATPALADMPTAPPRRAAHRCGRSRTLSSSSARREPTPTRERSKRRSPRLSGRATQCASAGPRPRITARPRSGWPTAATGRVRLCC